MLTSIQIENFRCFDRLKVDGLSRVNLIAGKNNVGKTSLLEAINLLAAGANPHAVVGTPFRRSPQVKLNQTLANSLLFQPLFNQLNSLRPRLKITGSNYYSEHSLEISYAKSRTLRLELSENESLTNIGPSIASNKDLIFNYSLRKLDVSAHLNHKNLRERNLENRVSIQENNFIQSMSEAEEIPICCSVIPAHTHLSNYSRAELIGEVELQGKREALVGTLRLLEPRLKNLT
ncbi:MAG: AAA family ATPase, partial [Cyanobacteria bacterium P01_A01_bin.137]